MTVKSVSAEDVRVVALMAAVTFAKTVCVETVKKAVLSPFGTTTDAGIDAAELEELSFTITPSAPAFALSVTDPVARPSCRLP